MDTGPQADPSEPPATIHQHPHNSLGGVVQETSHKERTKERKQKGKRKKERRNLPYLRASDEEAAPDEAVLAN